MMELPKWPTLLVKGRRITKEQADLVIIRTTFVDFMGCNNERWNRYVKKAFRLYKYDRIHRVPWEKWDELRARLGVLSLQYLTNHRISSTSVGGPHGWCDWDGTVGTDGISLMSKWPSVEEIHEEWTTIAQAFPFLELEAQLVQEEWDEPYEERNDLIPLVRWTVSGGVAKMHPDPGELLCPLGEDEDVEEFVARFLRPDAEIGVHHRRLTSAVRRALRNP